MKILILKKDRIIPTILPNTIYGDFQIKDFDDNGNQIDLLTIREENSRWVLNGSEETSIIMNNQKAYNVVLSNYFCCEIKTRKSDYNYFLYCLPTYENTTLYQVMDANIQIGNNNADIVYQNNVLGNYNINIHYDKAWYIDVLNDAKYIYLNNKRVTSERLYNGDVVFILGLRIVVLGNFMIINNPFNMVRVNGQKLKMINLVEISPQSEIEEELNIYNEDDYFFRNPRFKRNLVDEKFSIDSPPENQDPEGMPMLLTLASSMTMAASSSMSLYTVISRLDQGASMNEVLPTLFITLIMLISSLLIPVITRIYEKHRNKGREKYFMMTF